MVLRRIVGGWFRRLRLEGGTEVPATFSPRAGQLSAGTDCLVRERSRVAKGKVITPVLLFAGLHSMSSQPHDDRKKQ